MIEANNADWWIEHLGLAEHPEGGYFRETFFSDEWIDQADLPERYASDRSYSSILFLLKAGGFSAFHRLKSDELWYYHAGNPVNIYTIDDNGIMEPFVLGNRVDAGESFQVRFRRGIWFAAECNGSGGFSVIGCSVSPGFSYEDFELAEPAYLISSYPEHREIIERYTRS